jgi:hypothetical protein
VSADVIAHSWWRLVPSYAVGVWGGLTTWAALAQYVLPGRAALALGVVFPLSVWMLGPVFGLLDAGMIPALAWCVVGSALAGGLLRWLERRETAT